MHPLTSKTHTNRLLWWFEKWFFCRWDPHASVIWKTIYGGPTYPWDMEKKSSHVSSHASPPYARVVHTDAAMVVPVSWLTRGGEARWWLGLGVEGKGGRQGVCEHGNGIVDRFSREGGGGHDELLPMHVQTTSSSSRTHARYQRTPSRICAATGDPSFGAHRG